MSTCLQDRLGQHYVFPTFSYVPSIRRAVAKTTKNMANARGLSRSGLSAFSQEALKAARGLEAWAAALTSVAVPQISVSSTPLKEPRVWFPGVPTRTGNKGIPTGSR
jgi:hypothetical protein